MTTINDILNVIYKNGSAILDSTNRAVKDTVAAGLIRETSTQGAFCVGRNREYTAA